MDNGNRSFIKVCLTILALFVALVASCVAMMQPGSPPSQAITQVPETEAKIFPDKLVPTKVLQIIPADQDSLVDIMVGVDGNHLVSIALHRNEIYQGLHTSPFPSRVIAFNGQNNQYAHSPKKHHTTLYVTINTLIPKVRHASITISGRLVRDQPGGGDYLDIIPVTLQIQGEDYTNLLAEPGELKQSRRKL
jgi:hypothetical protein